MSGDADVTIRSKQRNRSTSISMLFMSSPLRHRSRGLFWHAEIGGSEARDQVFHSPNSGRGCTGAVLFHTFQTNWASHNRTVRPAASVRWALSASAPAASPGKQSQTAQAAPHRVGVETLQTP